MTEPIWDMETHSWIRHEPKPRDSACPRCIGGTLLKDQLGNEACLNCGHINKLVFSGRGGGGRDMARKPNAPTRLSFEGNGIRKLIEEVS